MEDKGAGSESTFDFVFADVDVRGRGDCVGGKVIDHFVRGMCERERRGGCGVVFGSRVYGGRDGRVQSGEVWRWRFPLQWDFSAQ